MSSESEPYWPDTDVLFSELVDGFDDIADLTIPFASLPGRARKAYPDHYRLWSDLAGLTIGDLLAHKPGPRTVAALLAAARREVAAYREALGREPESATQACARLLDAFDDRDRLVVTKRIIAREPMSQPEVARRAGARNATWVVRHQPRIAGRLAELLAHPGHVDVVRYAEQLHADLGPYAPVTAADTCLLGLGVQPVSAAADLLLHAAGPYIPDGLWLQTAGGRERVEAARQRLYNRVPAPDMATMLKTFGRVGMPVQVIQVYLATLDLALIDGKYVQWGERMIDQIEAILHAWARPATAAEIHRKLGKYAADAVETTLKNNLRFKRITRTMWGLEAWKTREYTGIADAIGARIDAAGGTMASDALLAEVCADIPDVTENSVRSNMRTLAFVNVKGMVRRRRDDDPLPRIAALNTVRGVFRQGDSVIRFGMVVNRDALRGSGQPFAGPLSAAVGVAQGQQRIYRTQPGTLAVSWRLDSTRGPSIGSVRALASAHDTRLGDTLVLIFDTEAGTVDAAKIPANVTGRARLEQLTGLTGDALTPTTLAASLDCTPAEIADILARRGDVDLAATVVLESE